MEQLALYLGYIVIILIALSLIGLSIIALCGTALGFYRIIKYKQTSKLIRKYETSNMYKASKIAVDFLMSKGISEDNKIGEVLRMMERYRKRYNIDKIEG